MILNFELLEYKDHQIKALYDFLSRRSYKISHKKIPSYTEHEEFVLNHPYRIWFLLKANNSYIGSLYLTNQNTIGIDITEEFIQQSITFIIDEIKSKFKPLPEIKSIRTNYFSINVAPNNFKLISALETYGCTVNQINYLII
jgi:hypothetical protein